MPGFDVAGMREAWQCALADGNKAQIMDAFRAQQFSAESFEPGELVSKYTLQKALGMEGGDALRKDLAHFVVAR